MDIDKVPAATIADLTTIETPHQVASVTDSQMTAAQRSAADPLEPSNTESDIGRKQSVLRDPGELILTTDAWRGTPASERMLSSGPPVPRLASTDLVHAVDHAVLFVMDRP